MTSQKLLPPSPSQRRPLVAARTTLRRRLNLALLVGLFGAGILATDLLAAIAAQTQDLVIGDSSPSGETEQVEDWVESSRATQEAGPPSSDLETLGNTQAILQDGGDNDGDPKSAPLKAEPAQAEKAAVSPSAVSAIAPGPKQQATGFSGGSVWQRGSFPVENFQSYTSAFGYRNFGGRWAFHRGLDLAAPKGSYVRNWWAGKVIKISDGGLCGTTVRIQSGNWQHVYCHLKGRVGTRNGRRYLNDAGSGLEIWEGQMVQTGARIGRVGMTGRTTGPHLHWGIKYGKDWIDPALVLRAMYASGS